MTTELDAARREVERLRLILGDYRADHPELEPLYRQGIQDGQRIEREACARLAESMVAYEVDGSEIAGAIRARGSHEH